MSFPLVGLLRVRGAQERVAAETLSQASAAVAVAEAAELHAEHQMSTLTMDVVDAKTMRAMSATRAASRVALSDLQALTALRRSEEVEAKQTHVEARRELKGLERLEAAHAVATTKASLHAEQTSLDEIAVTRAARAAGGLA